MSSLPVLVLDPGHGGAVAAGGSSPNNASGPDGALEKDLTLDLSRRVAALVQGRATVVLTRDGDRNLSLTDRARIARERDADLFVSIHFNGFADPSVDGTETWVARDASDASRRLAESVLERVVAVTGAPNRGLRESDFGVLLPARHAPRTGACLLEVAFLTNPDEARRLHDDGYRERLAQAIADAVLARLTSTPATAQAWAGPLGPAEAAIIATYTDYAGLNLRERDLAADLLGRLPADPAAVGRILDAVDWANRDDVGYHLLNQATSAQLSGVAAAPGGRPLLMRIVRELQDGITDADDQREIERVIVASSPVHARLVAEPWAGDPLLAASLAAAGATVQSIGSASGAIVYDEFTIAISAMPPGLTAEAYCAELADDLNRAVANPAFDRVNVFMRPRGAPPAIGDIVEIDIVGPENGSVVLVEAASDHFIFQTVNTPKTGVHPESGSRQFGFERDAAGDVVFYTRAASRPSLPGAGEVGMWPQNLAWTAFAEGIAAELTRRGGTSRSGSFAYWTSLPHGPTSSLGVSLGATDDARTEIAAFRARGGPGAFTPARAEVADRLEALVADPALVRQASLNLCGPAALARVWLARDPRGFVGYVISLYETGRAAIGRFDVAPGPDLRGQDYDGVAKPAMQAAGGVCPAADWIGMSALRDVSNVFLDFEGLPDETLAGLTTPAEMAEWLRATGIYSTVRDEGNWFFTRDAAHVLGLTPGPDRDVILLVNAHILGEEARLGQQTSDELLRAFPNHYVVLQAPVSQPAANTVRLLVWTFGGVQAVEVTQEVFEANYYGAIIGDV